jgi:hypothetical protein
MKRDDDERRQHQARLDLERLEREREKMFQVHAPANDDDDPYERLGKRIAHIIGPIIGAALLVYLFVTYLT